MTIRSYLSGLYVAIKL